MKLKKTYYNHNILCLLFVIYFLLPTSYFLYGEPGTTAFNFLKIATGVRGAGMGEAFTAVADDMNAIYWNPAGLSQVKYKGVSAEYLKWFQDIDYQTVSFVLPLNIGTFAGSLYNLSFGKIEGYNAGGVPTDKISTFDRAFIVSYSNILYQKLSAGANIKVIQEKLDDDETICLAGDVGLLFKAEKPAPVNLAVAVQNIGNSVTEDPLPLNIKLGASSKFLNDDLTFDVDYNIPKDRVGYFNVGTEYQFLDLLMLRVGYKFRDINGIRFGFGVGNEKISFDYAFAPYGLLGDTHHFGMNIYFGKSHELDVINEKIEKYLKKGKRYFEKKDLIEAQEEFKNVLVYDPTNQEAKDYLDKITVHISEANIEKHLVSGKKYLEKNDFLKAEQEFTSVLLVDKENVQAKKYLAEVQEGLLKEKKQRLEILFNQGLEFYNRDEFEDAISIWEKVILLDPEHASSKEYIVKAKIDIEKRERRKLDERYKILYEKALEFYNKGNYKKALGLFTEISQKSDGTLKVDDYLTKTKEKVANMYLKEGQKLFENGFYKEAITVLNKSLECVPDYKEALDYIKKCQEKVNEEFEKNKVLADEYNNKGLIEYNQGNLKEAIKFWEDALKLNPGHESAAKNLERAKKELKK
ncbi:MAG: PorV/PorQ family protein [Elusimicrobia bacterium]|nr:PorV/PorQ family protein [Elusimicrobiota bacterium]